jgi:hypothetical protein
MSKVLIMESGFLRDNKKAKGRVVLIADKKRIWMQVEDKKSDINSPSVIHEQEIAEMDKIFGLYKKPSSDIYSMESLQEIEIILNDGSAQSLGNFSTSKTFEIEQYLGLANILEFGKIQTKPEVSFFGSESSEDDAKGIVRFALTSSNLHISFGESAEIASAGFEKDATGKFVKVVTIDKSMAFDIDEFDGRLSTEVQKRARVGATIALFPVVGLATILIPAKKVSVTSDTRTYELRMAGKGWQLHLITPLSSLGYILRLRETIQNQVANKSSK